MFESLYLMKEETGIQISDETKEGNKIAKQLVRANL